MKKHTIIGSAGHIDHGKTAVIKALTGIDTDRLKEEKERGITIDLGFAYWKDDVTIIDVPGHEKFIRNMVAGVSTVDLFLLVIAADDGIMPQTIEHLDILSFFNVRKGLVVLNKIDLVDAEWLDLIREEIKELLNKNNFENIPVIELSAVKNQNVELLKSTLENLINDLEETSDNKPFRLLVDRSFSVKGFGTVVTGTVLSGSLAAGQDVQIYPSERKIKVRGIQEHIKTVESVRKGDRAAINLQGINKDEVIRGDVIAESETMMAVSEFTGIIKTVSELPLKVHNRGRIRIHAGTAERIGRMIWFEDDKVLAAQKTYHVRIKLEESLSCAPGDAFLIRLHSPLITLAGGKVIEINPLKIKQKKENWINYIEELAEEDLGRQVELILAHSGLHLLSTDHICKKTFNKPEIIQQILDKLESRKKIRAVQSKGKKVYLHTSSFNQLTESIPEFLKTYHQKNPVKPGINIQELSGGMELNWLSPEVIHEAIKKLVNSEVVIKSRDSIALADFKMQISKDVEVLKSEVLDLMLNCRFSTPSPAEISEQLQITAGELHPVLKMLEKENLLMQIAPKVYIHTQNFRELCDFLNNYFESNPDMPVNALKEYIQTSRKFAIPLFEFLDGEGYTIRKGDIRIKGKMLEN